VTPGGGTRSAQLQRKNRQGRRFFDVFRGTAGLEQSKPGKNMEKWRFLLEKNPKTISHPFLFCEIAITEVDFK
jgi:hypothetical protein